MADKKDKKKVPHCKCGKFAVVGGDKCVNCARLEYLEIKVLELNNCRLKNVLLKQEVDGLDSEVKILMDKKESPILLTIHAKTWKVDREYLSSFLQRIAPVADALKVTWKFR